MIEKNKKGVIKINEYQYLYPISKEGKDLVKRLLSKDPAKRPNSTEALKDPWFEGVNSNRSSVEKQSSNNSAEQEEADDFSTYDFSEGKEEIAAPRSSLLKVSKSFSLD